MNPMLMLLLQSLIGDDGQHQGRFMELLRTGLPGGSMGGGQAPDLSSLGRLFGATQPSGSLMGAGSQPTLGPGVGAGAQGGDPVAPITPIKGLLTQSPWDSVSR